MRLALALVACLAVVQADQASFDCPMRQLMLEYAAKIQPYRPQAALEDMATALVGSATGACNLTVPATAATSWPPAFTAQAGASYYVDATKGSDSNSGSMSSPFQTIAKAVSAARAGSHPATVNLRAGTFFMDAPVQLGVADSGLTIQAYNGEAVTVSGGRPLTNLSWKPYNVTGNTWIVQQNENAVDDDVNTTTTPFYGFTKDWETCEQACQANSSCNAWTWHDSTTGGYALQCYFRTDTVYSPKAESGHVSGYHAAGKNIYVADLSASGITSIPGLRQNGNRLIRARYPNADPEAGFGSNLQAKGWVKTSGVNPDVQFMPKTPYRNNSYGFNYYQLGIGGEGCNHFTPPAGYWCGNQTSGGGAFTYHVPTGIMLDQSVVPNMPTTGYTNVQDVEIMTWRPAHWSSWMFAMDSFDASTSTYTFSKGGFQGARGDDHGDNFYVNNAFEELDAQDEFYFNTATKMLYLYYNGTGAPPADLDLVATNNKMFFNVTGDSMAAPAKDVVFRGITFRDTAYTYLDPHGMPSGGDWGLQRSGAMFFQRTEGVVVDSCTFIRLDGNAVMVSAYNRGLQLTRNEFAWTGDNVIAQWGNTQGSPVYGMGPDGTNGDQPRGSLIQGNIVRELGIWEKQSSFYMHAKACQATIVDNIAYNGPRSGMNFNDGFGGGNNVSSNIIFNICRESGDHGPFNSWDRQLYVTDVATGKPSPYPAFNEITKNFMIANYDSQEAIDNDDGSSYYHTYENVLFYSGNGMKSDFGGHDNMHHDNLYGYIGQGFRITTQDPAFPDFFYNNQVIQTHDGDYGNGYCNDDGEHAKTVVYNNTIYTPTGKVTECGMSLADWQAKGNDKGTTAHAFPADDDLATMIRNTLDL